MEWMVATLVEGSLCLTVVRVWEGFGFVSLVVSRLAFSFCLSGKQPTFGPCFLPVPANWIVTRSTTTWTSSKVQPSPTVCTYLSIQVLYCRFQILSFFFSVCRIQFFSIVKTTRSHWNLCNLHSCFVRLPHVDCHLNDRAVVSLSCFVACAFVEHGQARRTSCRQVVACVSSVLFYHGAVCYSLLLWFPGWVLPGLAVWPQRVVQVCTPWMM